MPDHEPDVRTPLTSRTPVDRLSTGRFGQLIAHRFAAGEALPPGAPWPSATRVETVGETSATTVSGDTIVASGAGAFRVRGTQRFAFGLPAAYRLLMPPPHPDTEIRSVCGDRDGHVWLATSHGAYLTDGADWWQPLNAADGMPREDLYCIALGQNGDLWGGTDAGAWRLRAGTWRFFRGRRWLPGDRVRRIRIEPSGAVWLATDGGAARIEERAITLEDKARHYEDITALRHNRRGWIADCRLPSPGDPDRGFVHIASDNDGLWTAIYCAAECYRYAVTREEEARHLAAHSLRALLDLVRMSGCTGFPARAIVGEGETVDGYDPAETVRVAGEEDPIWYRPPSQTGILAKGDTSSDELDGHYFAWLLFHDLVATREEQAELREVVSAVTDRLVEAGYQLIGHTGRRTRWGIFSPDELNGNPEWSPERALNSAELLSYLRVAYRICGDDRYLSAYEDLIRRHHYLANVPGYRRGARRFDVNHSDDELAYLVYYPLLMLETDPGRRAVLLETVGRTWHAIRPERSPFYNAVYGAVTGLPCAIEEAAGTLREWPWELIDWDVRNSDRHDVNLQRDPYTGRVQTRTVLPASERPIQRWNGNPYQADGGSAGRHEDDGGAWLLSYWMSRYHGLLRE